MGFNSILFRYLLKELIPPFFINLAFFTFIFLMTKILDITNMIVNYDVSLVAVMLMFVYNMPFFLIYIFPMATMMSTLLTLLRLSNDNEIVALRACGVSLKTLLPPVMTLCLIGCLLAGAMSIYGLPWGRTSFKKLAVSVASSSFELGLKERTFNDTFDDIVLYINEIDNNNKELVDVFIEDQRDEHVISTIIAPRGRLYSNPGELMYRFRLFDGNITQVDLAGKTAHMVHFDSYDINLDMKHGFSESADNTKDEEEMSLGELRQYLTSAEKNTKAYNVALTEFHRKFSVPFACFALGLIAIPFGVQFKSAKRSFGLGLGLIFFLIYYLMLSAGWVLGEAGIYPPVIGMWVPNVVMGASGIYFFTRSAQGKPLHLDFFFDFLDKVFIRLRKR
ncbi:MAG: LPS export ABC transporter permease LptF [Desulfobacteraceae bacterium]|nr:LPS export ABC transporter permease LptF [Desulfobacteraceae bacterium]